MITNKSKLIINNRAIKILKDKNFYLIYLMICIAKKLIMKISKNK